MINNFLDRREAGELLASKIAEKFNGLKSAVILGLPRGGVVVASVIAKKFDWPLDIVVTRKLGHPLNPEFAIAAVSEHEIILSSSKQADSSYILDQSKKEREEIRRRIKVYRRNGFAISIKNKTVFLVDDGIATGLTAKVAILELKRQNPKEIIVATPVISKETFLELKKITNEVVALIVDDNFQAVGQYYRNFPQQNDEEVLEALADGN